MARLENQISNSSEEEEEEELSTEGSESESEPGKTSTPPPSSKKSPNSSSDDESETESESDPEKAPDMKKKNLVANPNPNPNPNVKPLASKPMEDDEVVMDELELKKPRSKNPTSRYSPPLIKPSAGKRPAAAVVDGGDLDSKRMAKKKTVVAMAAPDALVVVESNNSNGIGGGEKKQLFQRLWSENDEIELIKGMISYVEEKGKDPVSDVNEFHEFVKKSLKVDVNTRQMTTKVRRLKKKFENNAAKVENKGKVRSFSNPHEKEMYHLSKSLWGSDGNSNGVMSSKVKKVRVTSKTNKIPKNSKGVGSGNGDVVLDVTPISVKPKAVDGQGQGQPSSGNGFNHLELIMGLGPVTDEMIMIKGLELASEAKRVEFLQKWKDLKMMELKHFVEKVDLLKEQAEVVMDAIENSGGAN